MRPARPIAMPRNLCISCYKQWSRSRGPMSPQRSGLQNSDRIQRRFKGYIAPAGEQARPITGFYEVLLENPMRKVAPATRTAPSPPPPESLPKTEKEETLQKARIVFGSKLAGPGERKKEIEAQSREIAGIIVPPRPTEPDNCCMSGCVNCVWDMYRDEMEEWAAKSTEARLALQAQKEQRNAASSTTQDGRTSELATSMDDDGGGSETNWTPSVEQDKLFDDIPVGIREFMKTEKKLRQRHQEEQALSN